jgi:hypothetical protein
MSTPVRDRARPEQEQIRLRLRPGLDDHRVLGGDDGAIAGPRDEQSDGVDHAAGVPRADRRHLDDLALDQLDALVGTEDAGLAHPVVRQCRELELDTAWSMRRLRVGGCRPRSEKSELDAMSVHTGGVSPAISA